MVRIYSGGLKAPEYLVIVKKAFDKYAINDIVILKKKDYKKWSDHIELIKIIRNKDDFAIKRL